MQLTRRRPQPDLLRRDWQGQHVVVTNWKDLEHPESGGSETYCEAIAAAIAARGARVTLLTSQPKGLPRESRRDFGLVVRRGGRFGTYLRGLMWLARHRYDIDAVVDSESGIPYFSPLAVRRGTPVALVVHHVHQDQFDEYFPKPISLIGKFAERQASDLVYGRRPVCAVSPTTLADVRERLGLRGPLFVTPNAILRQAADRSPGTRPAVRLRASSPTIVSVGRLAPHKRWDQLIAQLPDVLQRHPTLQLHLIGDGPCADGLRQQVVRLGLEQSVVLHGRLPEVERDVLLAGAWLSATTSAREGWGLSVMEAAALGVPTVALSAPGLVDSIIDGVTGRLVRDPADLGRVLGDMIDTLADPERAEPWSRQCEEWARSFSWAATADQILAALTSAQPRGPRRRRPSAVRQSSVAVVDRSTGPNAADPSAPHGRPIARRLRATDQVRIRDGRVEVLLHGCSAEQAHRVLRRAGLSVIEVRPAVAGDLLGWPAAADGWRDVQRS